MYFKNGPILFCFFMMHQKTLRRLFEILFLSIHYLFNTNSIKFDPPLCSLCNFLMIYSEFAVLHECLTR